MREKKGKKIFFLKSFFLLYKQTFFENFLCFFRQFIQSFVGFISCLCFLLKKKNVFMGNGRVLAFDKLFLAVVRNSMNVIANVKKLFEFFVIDGKGRVGIRAIL